MSAVSDFLEAMRPYWSAVALGVTWAGIGIVWWRRRREWSRKQFLSQVNFSLNYVQDNQLVLRTLLEMPASEVWLNEHGTSLVSKASRQASVEQPFISLKNPRDQDFLNRAVLNVLSERFAETYLAAAMGVPVRRESFIFGITCEKYGEIRTLKVRVLVLREQTLLDLFGPTRGIDHLPMTNQVLAARKRTLEVMYRHYCEDQGGPGSILGRVELGLPHLAG